jgi:hypothetical protein
MAITVQLPKDGSGFEAEVKVGEDLHLVLRAVNTGRRPRHEHLRRQDRKMETAGVRSKH